MPVPRTSKHSVIATPVGGARFSARIRNHSLQTDQPEKLGGTDTAPTPLELLSVSLASCIALYVHRFCEAESLNADDLAVEVKPFWRENPGRVGRFDAVVHIPETIPAAYHAAIEEVARKCPVHHTLSMTPEITVQLQELALPAMAAD
jgi:putative redox protein